MLLRSSSALTLLLAASALVGCSQKPAVRVDYQLGEKIPLGHLTYNIIQASWQTQLGDSLKARYPQNRFLLLDISVSNGGGSDISLPLFNLEGPTGQSYPEVSNGEGVDNWFGLLRSVQPAQTQQGRIVFDVPLSSYRLRVTDGGEPGTEKFAFVTIPLRMDIDTTVQSPVPGAPVQ